MANKKADERSILHRVYRAFRSRRRLPSGDRLATGVGDDAAVWRPKPGYELILSCDWFLEATHFILDRHPPESVGFKCLARAVSDIAAMGGSPSCFLLSLALPAGQMGDWLDGFLRGLRKASRLLRCPMAGGDTTRHREVLINITVVGETPRGRALLRSGARPGDAVFVTGRLGEAEYGLRLLLANPRHILGGDRRMQKHFYPRPRLAVAVWLRRRRLATAMMDLSDGLSSDLPKLCQASGVGARIHLPALPCVRVSRRDLRNNFNRVALSLHGGDDYELLFTVARKNVAQFPSAIAGVPVTQIGEICGDKRVLLVDETGVQTTLQSKGWDPFR